MNEQQDVVSLNADDLDISELEQRLEMTISSLRGDCGVHYGNSAS